MTAPTDAPSAEAMERARKACLLIWTNPDAVKHQVACAIDACAAEARAEMRERCKQRLLDEANVSDPSWVVQATFQIAIAAIDAISDKCLEKYDEVAEARREMRERRARWHDSRARFHREYAIRGIPDEPEDGL